MRFACVSSHQLDMIEQREGRLPVGRSPALATPSLARRAIYQMDEAKLETWIDRTRAGLDYMIQRNDAYTRRRQARGTYTPTDIAIECDIRLDDDVRAALTELVILWRMAHTSVSLGSHSPPTGMLIDYVTLPGSKMKS